MTTRIQDRVFSKTCIVNSCFGRQVSILGYCGKHYMRNKRGQDLHANTIFSKRYSVLEGSIAKIPLGVNGKDGYAIVDKEYAYLDKFNWHKSGDGYAARSNPKTRMHHLIIGKPKHPIVVDHINNNKLDNRKSNLRFADYCLNGVNREKPKSNSGHQGIHYDKKAKGYRVYIAKDKIRYQKFCKNLKDAIKFREEKYDELYKA